MIWRSVSALMTLLSLWAAYLQLNDPDPERWTAMYLACAAVALMSTLNRGTARMALAVAGIALAWALAIVPELIGTWSPADFTATMVPERPEIEFGRECGGLLIVASYCVAAFFIERRATRGHALPEASPA